MDFYKICLLAVIALVKEGRAGYDILRIFKEAEIYPEIVQVLPEEILEEFVNPAHKNKGILVAYQPAFDYRFNPWYSLISLPLARKQVCYGSKQVECGNDLTPTIVKDMPTIRWKANSEDYYTLMLIDPDAPCRKDPKYQHFVHCMIVNIRGCDCKSGETLLKYIGSGPPKGTGCHRYIFLLFKQPGKICCKERFTGSTEAQCRSNFNLRKFCANYKLKLISMNFYRAKYDEHVPIIQAILDLKKQF